MTLRRRALGEAGEAAAARFLENLGWTVLERGFRCRLGEVDLVARDGETLVFVEVKTRAARGYGEGEWAVTPRKQAHIARAALAYLSARSAGDPPIRFDVLILQDGETRHIKDAFSARGFTR